MTAKHRLTAAEKLWANVTLDPVTGCEMWNKATDGDGYGVVTGDDGKQVRTHRLAWMIAYGSIPDGMQVLHHCDTPGCLNVADGHLWLGTQAQNVADRHAKGRDARGASHGRAKLSDEQVSAIRAAYIPRAPGVAGNARQVAEAFGIARSYVRRLHHGEYRSA